MNYNTKFLHVLLLLSFLAFASYSCGDTAPAANENETTTVGNQENADGNQGNTTGNQDNTAGNQGASNSGADTDREYNKEELVEAPDIPLAGGILVARGIRVRKSEKASYTIDTEIRKEQSEGQTLKVPVRLLKSGETVLMEITPEYDANTNTYTDEPKVILVHNGRFRTQRGIGVGSTLEEVMAAYPDASLSYTYVGDMFVAETPALPQVQFLIQPKSYIGKANLQSNDQMILRKEDFRVGAPVVYVRVY